MDEIIEWMATLRREDGNNPPRTMRLVGTVDNNDYELSFETMRQVANFDSLPDHQYEYPANILSGEETENWNDMLAELFIVNYNFHMARSELKPLVLLLTQIMGKNVIPRLSDMSVVRHYDIRVLYALVTGQQVLSFRHLVMLNVWESRESYTRKAIPHCRLLSTLLRMNGAVEPGELGVIKKHTQLRFSSLNRQSWEYVEEDRYHVLIEQGSKARLRFRKWGLDPSPEREEMPEQEVNQEIPPQPRTQEVPLEEFVRDARPPDFMRWPYHAQVTWDRNIREAEEQRRLLRRMEEQQRLYARAHAFMYQTEVNDRYLDNEQRRHYEDYYAGRDYAPHPAPVPWETLPRYDGGPRRYPAPETHPSRWLPIPPPPQGPSSSADPFNMGGFQQEVENLFQEWFPNQPQQRPYDPAYYDPSNM
jgi:hypothetical protein